MGLVIPVTRMEGRAGFWYRSAFFWDIIEVFCGVIAFMHTTHEQNTSVQYQALPTSLIHLHHNGHHRTLTDLILCISWMRNLKGVAEPLSRFNWRSSWNFLQILSYHTSLTQHRRPSLCSLHSRHHQRQREQHIRFNADHLHSTYSLTHSPTILSLDQRSKIKS